MTFFRNRGSGSADLLLLWTSFQGKKRKFKSDFIFGCRFAVENPIFAKKSHFLTKMAN